MMMMAKLIGANRYARITILWPSDRGAVNTCLIPFSNLTTVTAPVLPRTSFLPLFWYSLVNQVERAREGSGMREELKSLRSLQDGNENRGQLFAFLSQRCELFHADNSRFHEQFQPVGAFFNLAQRIAAFRDELSFAARAECFAIISADRSSRPKQLLPKHLRLRCLRERGKHAYNPKRESLRPIA